MKDKTLSDEEILKRAIYKAVKNGYQWETQYWKKYMLAQGDITCIIFDKDFAKAFWPYQEDVCSNCGIPLDSSGYSCEYHDMGYKTLKCWQYHLQTMVLEENPIKYLSKFL